MSGVPAVLAASLMLVLPLALALPPPDPIGHDDAGSGQDAPGERVPDIVVEPDRVYDGSISYTEADHVDHYAFHAAAGQSVHARANGFHGCIYVLGPGGEELSGFCSFGQELRYSVWAKTEQAGIHYLRVNATLQFVFGPLDPPPSEHIPYQFVLTLDGFAPATDDVPDGNLYTDDADSGHDAPDAAVPLIVLENKTQVDGFVGWAAGDRADWYAFEGRSGQVVEVGVYAGPDVCVEIRTGIGNEDPCTHPLLDYDEKTLGIAYRKVVHTLTQDGTAYVFVNGVHGHYGLGLGIGGPAPQPAIPGESQLPHLGSPIPQDDAGSGGDAPDNDTAPGPLVQSGTIYEGILTGLFTDLEDRYMFTAMAGQSLHLRVFGIQGCAGVYAPDGDDIGSSCQILQNGVYSVFARAPVDGMYHLFALSEIPADYRFVVMLDDFAPDPSPLPLPPLPYENDAGSGHDAPDTRVPLLSLGTGTYEGASSILQDWSDWYLVSATEGQTVTATVRSGGAGCVAIWHVDEEIKSACTIRLGAIDQSATRVLDRPGEWYVLAGALTGPYQLSVGIDQDPPSFPTIG